MTEPILELDGVWKNYSQAAGGELHALRDVSAAAHAGRSVALIGRSGSGKSTFLHIAAGIDLPTRGTVHLMGRALHEQTERERTLQRRDSVGLVFQFFHLLPHLTVWDNVILPAMISGDRRSAYGERAEELLRRVELLDRRQERVERLSGGEMQRVAICRSLVRRPRLLLADEPTGNLDDDSSRSVMDLLLQLAAEERQALIYVTHSRTLAALADETWRIHSGVLETA